MGNIAKFDRKLLISEKAVHFMVRITAVNYYEIGWALLITYTLLDLFDRPIFTIGEATCSVKTFED